MHEMRTKLFVVATQGATIYPPGLIFGKRTMSRTSNTNKSGSNKRYNRHSQTALVPIHCTFCYNEPVSSEPHSKGWP